MSDRVHCLCVIFLPVALLLLALPGSLMGQSIDKEPNDTPGQAIQLAVPISTNYGDISSAQDIDFYKFAGRAGTEVIFWVHPETDLAAIVAFYDSTGKVLAYNDKEANLGYGRSGIEPILYIKIPSDGDFFVSVSTAARFNRTVEGSTKGNYVLWVFPREYWTAGSDAYEPNDTRLKGKLVTLPFDSYGANLDYLGDVDWFRFVATSGSRISIDIEALQTEAHPTWVMTVSPRIGIFDEGGHKLMEVGTGTDPDDGFQDDPAVVFDVPRDGRYYVAVTSPPDEAFGSVFTDEHFLADPYVSSGDHMIGGYRLRIREVRSIFFPQIANGTFGSIYFATSMILINGGDIEATGKVSFFNADGTPMVISSAQAGGPASSFWLNIPPKGNYVLKTDGSGVGTSGYAKVEFTGTVGGSAIFSEYSDTGSLITEAAVGASTLMDFFTFPVDVTGDFNTGVAFANPESGRAVSLSLNLLDLTGTSVAAKTVSLEAGSQMAIYVSGIGQLFPSLRNFRGSLQVLADSPIPSVALRSSSRTLTTLPAVSLNQDWEPVTLHFPQLVVGPAVNSYRSTIVLTNPGYFTVSGSLRFTQSDGSPMAVSIGSAPAAPTCDFRIPPQGALFLESGPVPAQTAGYAVLDADHGLGGVVVFSQYDGSGKLLTEAAVPPAVLAQNFLIFAQSDASYNTGVALANVSGSSSVLNYLLHPGSGSDDVLQTDPAGLEAGRHNAEMIAGANQLFPAFAGTGILEVRSTQPIPAVALRLTPTTMTAVPVVPVSK